MRSGTAPCCSAEGQALCVSPECHSHSHTSCSPEGAAGGAWGMLAGWGGWNPTPVPQRCTADRSCVPHA